MAKQFLPFEEVSPFLQTLDKSPDPKARSQATKLMTLAHFYGHSTQEYLQLAIKGNKSQRLAIAEVAIKNLTQQDCSEWCVEQLKTLFTDDSIEVRKKAAGCFLALSNF